MEDELIDQRDAAIAVSHALAAQKAVIERRAGNAERLRHEAQTALQALEALRVFEKKENEKVFQYGMWWGIIGMISGWICGICCALICNQAILGFLIILPTMFGITLCGWTSVKTKMEWKHKKRQDKMKENTCKETWTASYYKNWKEMVYDWIGAPASFVPRFFQPKEE